MRWRTWAAAAAGLTLVFVPACSGGEDEIVSADTRPGSTSDRPTTSTTTAPRSSSIVTTRPATTTTGATTPDSARTTIELTSDDVLQRHDAPPPGVPAQITFALPSPLPPCAIGPTMASGILTVTPTSGRWHLGDTVDICIRGFMPDSPVSVQVSRPDGHTAQRPVVNNIAWPYRVDPMDPTGDYQLLAVQGATTARGAFTVGLPAEPRVFAIEPTRGPPGTTFRFVIIGSAPGQTIPLDLYRREPNLTYATTLDSVTTDDDGRGFHSLATGSDAAPGGYCVVGRPARNGCGGFVVQ